MSNNTTPTPVPNESQRTHDVLLRYNDGTLAKFEGHTIVFASHYNRLSGQNEELKTANAQLLREFTEHRMEIEELERQNEELRGAKSHMEYCRSLCKTPEDDVLASSIEELQQTITGLREAFIKLSVICWEKNLSDEDIAEYCSNVLINSQNPNVTHSASTSPHQPGPEVR